MVDKKEYMLDDKGRIKFFTDEDGQKYIKRNDGKKSYVTVLRAEPAESTIEELLESAYKS